MIKEGKSVLTLKKWEAAVLDSDPAGGHLTSVPTSSIPHPIWRMATKQTRTHCHLSRNTAWSSLKLQRRDFHRTISSQSTARKRPTSCTEVLSTMAVRSQLRDSEDPLGPIPASSWKRQDVWDSCVVRGW